MVEPLVVTTRTKEVRESSAPSRRAPRVSFHSTRGEFSRVISPVASPRITMAEDWFPAFPADPASMVRNRASTMFRSITAEKRVRMAELRDCRAMSPTSQAPRFQQRRPRGVPK